MKKSISARIELDLLDKVSKEGREQNRTFSNMMEVIIDSYFNPRKSELIFQAKESGNFTVFMMAGDKVVRT